MLRQFFAALLFPILFFACPPAPGVVGGGSNGSETSTAVGTLPAPAAVQTPRNIILLIGDGMGVSQITAGMYSNSNRLELERFRVLGLHKSYSSDNLVTDSAAGATAFSAGVKTYNGAIGVDEDTVRVPTILEIAEANEMSTGLISTSSIVHATPASFIAHEASRKSYEAIAVDFMATEVDLFIGGGKKFFDRRDSDERDLIAELRSRNYRIESYLGKDLDQLQVSTDRNFAYFTADAEPIPVAQGRDYLLPATRLATDYLSEKAGRDGFFLMIEGSQIDWGGHANDSDYIVSEMLEFDQAVGLALDFAQRDKHTLVIVTADHETGGYAINYGSKMDSIVPAFTSDYHTADLIPVFAYGPGAAQFGGIYENTDIHAKMMSLLGLD